MWKEETVAVRRLQDLVSGERVKERFRMLHNFKSNKLLLSQDSINSLSNSL